MSNYDDWRNYGHGLNASLFDTAVINLFYFLGVCIIVVSSHLANIETCAESNLPFFLAVREGWSKTWMLWVFIPLLVDFFFIMIVWFLQIKHSSEVAQREFKQEIERLNARSEFLRVFELKAIPRYDMDEICMEYIRLRDKLNFYAKNEIEYRENKEDYMIKMDKFISQHHLKEKN